MWPLKRKPRRGLGYRKDSPLSTDARYSAARPHAGLHSIDLREHVPAILDQGSMSACVGYAYAAAIAISESLAGLEYVPVSPRGIYYNSRALHGSERSDSGTFLRTAADALRRVGACPELVCPSEPKLVNVHPGPIAYMEGHNHRDGRFERLMEVGENLLDQIWAALCAGQPVVVGIGITQRFMDAGSGVTRLIEAPMNREPILGGHAVTIVGRDSDGYIIQNSWSPSWGENGFAWLTDEYLASHHAQEFVVIRDWNSVRPGRLGAA